MIKFACKRFDIDEVVRCSLNLTKTEFKILKSLLKKKEFVSTRKIASELGLGLSTVQKTTKKLRELGLLTQRQKNLEKGGYFYEYSISEKEKLIKIINEIINELLKEIKEYLKQW